MFFHMFLHAAVQKKAIGCIILHSTGFKVLKQGSIGFKDSQATFIPYKKWRITFSKIKMHSVAFCISIAIQCTSLSICTRAKVKKRFVFVLVYYHVVW